jgi:hypothetical protein
MTNDLSGLDRALLNLIYTSSIIPLAYFFPDSYGFLYRMLGG